MFQEFDASYIVSHLCCHKVSSAIGKGGNSLPIGDGTPLEMTNVICIAPSGVVKWEITMKSPFQSPLDLCSDSEPSACEHFDCCGRDHCLFSFRDITGHSIDKVV